MAIPDLIEAYENGDCELRVYELANGENRYWIRAGQALIELDEERLVQLLELLYAYVEEGE